MKPSRREAPQRAGPEARGDNFPTRLAYPELIRRWAG